MLVSERRYSRGQTGSLGIVPNLKAGVAADDVSTLATIPLDPSPYEWQSPNKATKVPEDVFPGEHAICVPDGFMSRDGQSGHVYIMVQEKDDIFDTNRTVRLTEHIENYWYTSECHWVDMNGDGRKDLLIARARTYFDEGRLIWLEQPDEFALDGDIAWKEHVIGEGPDGDISWDVLPQYPDEIIVWSTMPSERQLTLYRVSTVDGSLVGQRTIEEDIGLAWSAKMEDLNGDGTKQLLVSNWTRRPGANGVFAYTIPDDIMTGDFERFDIAMNFYIPWKYYFQMIGAPGIPEILRREGEEGRAHIILPGNGNESAYLLQPVGDASKFEYERHQILNGRGVIPSAATADVLGDGEQQVFIANSKKGYVEVFDTKPASWAQANQIEEEVIQDLVDQIEEVVKVDLVDQIEEVATEDLID